MSPIDLALLAKLLAVVCALGVIVLLVKPRRVKVRIDPDVARTEREVNRQRAAIYFPKFDDPAAKGARRNFDRRFL